MKNIYSVLALILFLCMLLLPLMAKPEGKEALPPKVQEQAEEEDNFLIKTDDGIKKLPAREYIIGVLAAEMPALYPEEALKAQAVAAYTYAARKRSLAKDKDYHLTDKSETDQAYITHDTMKTRWGENYEKYLEKITAAVDSVCGQAVLYGGEPIFAAYHAISCGKTEKGSNVWGGEYPYLQSVESVYDLLADGYKSEVIVSKEEFLEKLELTGEPEIGAPETTAAGTVSKIKIGGKEYTGSALRKLFSLRSASFIIEPVETGYKFSVSGYGHGVGLSQHGAKYMAEQGMNYKQILLWYYTDCEIK